MWVAGASDRWPMWPSNWAHPAGDPPMRPDGRILSGRTWKRSDWRRRRPRSTKTEGILREKWPQGKRGTSEGVMIKFYGKVFTNGTSLAFLLPSPLSSPQPPPYSSFTEKIGLTNRAAMKFVLKFLMNEVLLDHIASMDRMYVPSCHALFYAISANISMALYFHSNVCT